jgi:hypothetical protein
MNLVEAACARGYDDVSVIRRRICLRCLSGGGEIVVEIGVSSGKL